MGRVLATGGNTFDNSRVGEHWAHPCEHDSVPLDEITCEDGCPSVCVNKANQYPQSFGCGADPDAWECSLLSLIQCNCAAITAQAACAAAPLCSWNGTQQACANEFECDDVLDDAICGTGGRCAKACEDDGDCGDLRTLGQNDVCPVPSPINSQTCNPGNNACYAVKTAEIWDPNCAVPGWTEIDGEQEYPRMYHSTALLLPDGRVISMGGGHRGQLAEQPFSEYFEPAYAPDPAAGPSFGFGMPGAFEVTLGEANAVPANYLQWGGSLHVVLHGGDAPESAALVRLGSVTHGFDMDQRYIELAVVAEGGSQLTVSAHPYWPLTRHRVPPGYYMLFLLSQEREPGPARYVRVGDQESFAFVCEASSSFEAIETSCTLEPANGACPSLGITTTPVDPPTVDGPEGPVQGFRVVAPAGMVEDPDAPTAAELAHVQALCRSACASHFASRLGQGANCTTPGAFETPIVHEPAEIALDLVSPADRSAAGLFTGDTLGCTLGQDCHADFDEALGVAEPSRVTPAADPVSAGEEFRVGIAGELEADSPDATAPTAATIEGVAGYSECVGGSDEHPCAFYLGSLELALVEPLGLSLDCGESTPDEHELESFTLRLAQPAFGIAQEGTDWKAFPPGALVFEIEGVVDGIPFATRGPNTHPLYMFGGEGWLQMQGIDGAWFQLTTPCGSEQAEVVVWAGFHVDSWLEQPPAVSIDVPATVSCPDEIDLDHQKWDADNDIESVRWLVDGVLLEESLTSIDFTTGHELAAVIRDDRGATTTKTKEVSCQ